MPGVDGDELFHLWAGCGTLEELKRHRETAHPDKRAEPVQARGVALQDCFNHRFYDGIRGRLDYRGQVCPSCEFKHTQSSSGTR